MEPIEQRDRQLLLQFGITHQLRIKLTQLESSLRPQQKPKEVTITEPSFVAQFTATGKADGTSTHQTKRKYLRCYQCNYRDSSKTQLNLHYQSHKETGKNFSCDLCSSSYTSCRALKSHLNVHNGEKPYKCPHCPYKAAWPSNIRQHLQRNHKAIPLNRNCFPCLQCCQRFSSHDNLRCHVRRLHSEGVKPFKCDLCEYCFVTGAELKSHMRSHTGEKPFACALCSFKSATSSGLNMHMRTHTGEKPFQCSQCPYRACDRSSIKSHVNTWHQQIDPLQLRNKSTNKPFKCSQCDREYSHSNSLKTHVRWLHSGNEVRPIKCSLCNYAATTNAIIQRHMRTHTRERPFPCSLCNFSSADSSGLSRHIRTHTKEKPFKCSQCDYRAAERSSLSVHNRIHEYKGGRRVARFNCHICSKSFLSKLGLTVHIRTHTGEKPFSCQFCHREFLQRPNKHRHEKVCKSNPKLEDPIWMAKLKSFKCQLCDFCTSAKERLKEHSMIHTGVKPYKCIFCETRFRQASNKKRHEGICKLNPKQAESS